VKRYYIVATGAYNNAGDFLIAHRSKSLLQEIRPDRDIVEILRKKYCDKELIDLINNSEAILISGGPLIASSMWPGSLPFIDDFNKIDAPISIYSIGWRYSIGTRDRLINYSFSKSTLMFLDKIENNGFRNSRKN